MPWRPVGKAPAHRFDAYGSRVAALSRDGVVVGHLLALPNTHWRRVGGHLWWRRWAEPTRTANVFVQIPEERSPVYDDFYSGEALDALVAAWDRGEYEEEGVRYSVVWMDSGESRRLADLHFDWDLHAERHWREGP